MTAMDCTTCLTLWDALLRRAICVAAIAAAGCGSAAAPVAPAPPQSAPPQKAAPQVVQVVEPAETAETPPPAPTAAPPTAPEPVFRPDDRRPQHDDARLAAAGIHVYASRRLRLYTDIPPEAALPLPPLIDQVYDAWADYLGPLPPDRQGTEFQLTGYLMRDERLFREVGLIPEDLPGFLHGRHRQNEFWMRDQEYDYYRRHLLLHEGTHCYMTYMPDVRAPAWYLEGMAELFGTHRLAPDGKLQVRVMPTSPEEFAGLGRITLIREACAREASRSLAQAFDLRSEEFEKPEAYAWSWALCAFFDGHPRYRARFRELSRHLQGSAFQRKLTELFAADEPDLMLEWSLFVINLQYGYDVARAAIDFQPGEPLDATPRQVAVRSDRGWQSSQVLVEAGRTYRLRAAGRCTLADEPKPWVSEPDGVTFRYFDGEPLGKLLACLRLADVDAAAEARQESMMRVLPVGRDRTFAAPATGTLYLRINDAWSGLADNRGEVVVTIEPVAAPAQ